MAKITATNIVPHSLAPNVETEDMLTQLEDGQHQDQENMNCCSTCKVPKLTPEKERLLFNKIDLSGADSWDPKLVEEAKQLFHEYAHIFTLESLDMGHTSMVNMKLNLTIMHHSKRDTIEFHPIYLMKSKII